MRRSTRLSVKRIPLSPESSDEENESEESEPEPKAKRRTKSSRKRKCHDDSELDEAKETKPKLKTNRTAKASHKKPKKEISADDSSSESDIENYLQPANQINLDAKFFQVSKAEEKKSFEAIEKNIFAGINRLSGSESESEPEENRISPGEKSKNKNTKIEQAKGSSEFDFQQVQEYKRKLEEAKESVEKYEANKKTKLDEQNIFIDKKTEAEKHDISKLLALGEAKPDSYAKPKSSHHLSDFESGSEFEKEDWEEVEEDSIKETQTSIVPKNNLEIAVELPGAMRKKKGKDLVASMKRRLNRIRKENQILVHKVHLLCWLGHGNYINWVLNNKGLLAMAFSLIPSQHCYPAGAIDLKCLQRMVKWYKDAMPNTEKRLPEDMTLDKLLKLQIIRKEAFNKKILVYIFVCILRSLGIQCRLVLSFQVAPLRPPASELHSLSTKNKKDVEEEDEDVSNLKEIANIQYNGKLEEQKLENELASNKKDTKNKNKNKAVHKNKETAAKNAKETLTKSNAKTGPDKAGAQHTKTNKNVSTKTDKLEENDPENKSDSKKKTLMNAYKASSPQKKNLSATNKTSKLKSHENETEVKSKTRSQRTKEEKSQNKTRSDLLNAKLATRSRKSLHRILQVDGADDSDDEPITSRTRRNPPTKRMRKQSEWSDDTETDSNEDFKPQRLKRSAGHASRSSRKPNLSELNNSKPKPKERAADSKKSAKSCKSQKQSDDNDSEYAPEQGKDYSDSGEDSDYVPDPEKKKHYDSEDEIFEKKEVKSKSRTRVKKNGNAEEPKRKKGFDVWVEVYLEAAEKWISVDVVKEQVNCVSALHSMASHPITYIVAWNNDSSVKDITQRYCPTFNTLTRKLRIDKKWWDDALRPFEGKKTERDKKEDEELTRLQLEQPLPTTISEYKNHPLYVLKRHLLQVEALYPAEPVTLGFIREEPVYSRDCVHKLSTREVWYRKAKVIKAGETPYKVLKRPKWDRAKRKVVKDQPMELFGEWQVEDYVPPAAKNGIIPRNEYGNVDLFLPCMLPKGTVHLKLPGLNKLARKMNIDCATAMVGFDYHSGINHPVFDGFVVCEEQAEVLIAAWHMEQEEQEKKEREKVEKRVYDKWKKVIKGLLIRERLKARYDFGVPAPEATPSKKRKSTGSKLASKKRQLCSDAESE